MYWSNDKTSKDGCFSSCMQLEKSLLTGWSWSKSGSNLVTRWWHLSKSAIFFGNQWTRAEKKQKHMIEFSSGLFCFCVCVIISAKICLLFKLSAVTFDFFGGFNVLCVPFDGSDQSADVRQVHLAADEVLQAFQVVLELPAWSRLQMVNLRFERLKHSHRAS